MTWLAFPLTAFLTLQTIDAPPTSAAHDHPGAAMVVAQGNPGAAYSRDGRPASRRAASGSSQ